MGTMVTRKHRELSDDEIKLVFEVYHLWKKQSSKYQNIKGFCNSVNIEEVKNHEYILTPGRYVGLEEIEDDGESFENKMITITSELAELFAKSQELDEKIRKTLGSIGYEF